GGLELRRRAFSGGAWSATVTDSIGNRWYGLAEAGGQLLLVFSRDGDVQAARTPPDVTAGTPQRIDSDGASVPLPASRLAVAADGGPHVYAAVAQDVTHLDLRTSEDG